MLLATPLRAAALLRQLGIQGCVALLMLTLYAAPAFAEGSKDFSNYPGYRLWLDTRTPQQLKVYAAEGEYLNLGASHLGLSQGYIKVYRPDGSLHSTFDNTGATAGKGIIYNHTQEANGPTGNGTGYTPGVVAVQAGESGVWTVRIAYPGFQLSGFSNLLNGAAWSRDVNQPTSPRVILAWDITVSQNAAADQGGNMLSGRVYSMEYVSIINKNGFTTSPQFYILTEDGFQYVVDFADTDPFRFPIMSNCNGYLNADLSSTYESQDRYDIIRSASPNTWVDGQIYLYDPQAPDYQEQLVTNKLFFNPASSDLPTEAMVTDVFTNTTYTTWLYNDPVAYTGTVDGFEVISYEPGTNTVCGTETIDPEFGGYLTYTTNVAGPTRLLLDIDGNDQFGDPIDRELTGQTEVGSNQIFWDGKDGFGQPIMAQEGFELRYKFDIRGGETHILLSDVENSAGGITFELINADGSRSPIEFYYDHSKIGGGVSGGGAPGAPQATLTPYTYDDQFGNNRNFDYWTYVDLVGSQFGKALIDIGPACDRPNDHDGDGIEDSVDIDDDNDGIFDAQEYCHPDNGFACLPGGFDPSADNDADGILNWQDADDPQINNTCADADGDGRCDQTPAIYDRDGDNVPDHYDLDSDNDGISDLVEARLSHLDTNRDGIIDGTPDKFGLNGGFNELASDPDAFTAFNTETPVDHDEDGLPDHDDLDSDNDGLHDVREAGYVTNDSDNDGRLDTPTGVNANGLAPLIDIAQNGTGIPVPLDWEEDGYPDYLDRDSDNDGILDVEEIGLTDGDNDGVPGIGAYQTDSDGRVLDNGAPISNSRPMETDFDGIPDWHDHDTDNDGIRDVVEAGLTDDDANGFPGNGPVQVSEYGIPVQDAFNQIFTATANPSNVDGDDYADYRDRDSDNDGINDVAEADLPDFDDNGELGTGSPTVNYFGEPIDDGQGNPVTITSTPTDTEDDLLADFRDPDSDDDGISDVIEALLPDGDNNDMIGNGLPAVNQFGQPFAFLPNAPTSDPIDSDMDGTPDFRDLDSDNDNIMDADECPFDNSCVDGDEDGIPDYLDTDRDNDGIADAYECPDGAPCVDTDGDGIPDVDDLDSDNDGFTDADECAGGAPCIDSDSNGIDDFQQGNCGGTLPVAEPEQFTGMGTYCAGESVVLSANNNVDVGEIVTYIWFGPNNFMFQSDAPATGPFPLQLDDVTAAQAGQYALIVNTENGCSSDPIQLTLNVTDSPDQPVLETAQMMLCANDDATLTVTNPQSNTTYTWTHQSSGTTLTTTDPTATFTGIGAGTYSVQATQNGCDSEPSNTVTIEAEEALSFLEATGMGSYCAGEPFTLSVTGQGDANEQVDYVFTAPDGSTQTGTTAANGIFIYEVPTAQTTLSGNYTLSVTTAAGCAVDYPDPLMIEVNETPATPNISASTQAACAGSALELTTADAGNVSYQWLVDTGNGFGVLQQTTTPVLSTTLTADADYAVVIVAGNCASEAANPVTVSVSEAPTIAGLPQAVGLCVGEQLELSTAANTGIENWQVTWTTPDGTTFTQTVMPGEAATLSLLLDGMAASGNYELSVTTAGGCVADPVMIDVSVSPQPATPTVLGSTALLCAGADATLSTEAVAGATYTWLADGEVIGTSDEPTWALNPNEALIYSVLITVNGCTSEPAEGWEIDVEDNPIYLVDNASSPSSLLCPGDEVLLELDGQQSGTITWFGPGGYSSTAWSPLLVDLTPASGGAYFAEIVTEAGCTVTTATTTVFVQDEITAADDVLDIDYESAGQINVLFNDNLDNPDGVTLTVVGAPEHGIAVVNGRAINYIPAADYSGPDAFTYEICRIDCPDVCATAKVTITVGDAPEEPVDPEELPCTFPNIFTPNDDGVNDFLRLPCLATPEYKRASLTIFNRRGDEVFAAQPYTNNFDGRYKGQMLPAGTYFYLLQPDPASDACETGYFTLTR